MPHILLKKTVREIPVSDVMHKGCISIRSDANLTEAIRKMQNAQVSSLIVEPRDAGDAYGIVTRRDILEKAFVPGAKRFNFSQHKVYEIMTKPFVTVSPGLKVKYAARLMARENCHRLPVFDGHKVVGMVSDSDIFRKI